MQVNPQEVSGEKAITDDPLYNEAVAMVVEHRRASIIFIQRRLRIGYHRAARMIEAMEADGIISCMNNDGARAVLVLEVPNVLLRN